MSKISVVNHRDEFISNMMAMLTRGTSNDVKLVLSDGEILANKDVLSAQSDYFATMFSNNKVKFIEGETNTVKFPHCNKNIMEKIVKYLFSGEMRGRERWWTSSPSTWMSCPGTTVCPRSGDPFYVVSYYIYWVNTSWTYSIFLDWILLDMQIFFFVELFIELRYYVSKK